MVSTTHAVQTPTVVLYDIMREAATRVRGEIIGARYDDPASAATFSAQLAALTDRVDAVDVDDRDRIIAMTAELREQYERFTAA